MSDVLKKNTIGILGGGQLGRMALQAAEKLGYSVCIFAQDATEPAAQICKNLILGEFTDKTKLTAFAKQCDVITLEWENVPVSTLEFLQTHRKVCPHADVLRTTQDRILEKTLAKKLGLGTPDFRAVANLTEAKQAVLDLGLPCVFKTARDGYDGKGQAIIRNADDVENAWKALNSDHVIAEAFVDFEKEISVIVARREDGDMVCFPAAHNIHKNGILDETHLPAILDAALETKAHMIAKKLAAHLGVVGLLAVEMFVTKNDVLINEMAPRPHNSGHWSMDFCETSQFEQFIRAICGLPLGSTELLAPCMMKNLIGEDANNLTRYENKPNTYIHLYGKTEPRAGRKMGHVNMKSV